MDVDRGLLRTVNFFGRAQAGSVLLWVRIVPYLGRQLFVVLVVATLAIGVGCLRAQEHDGPWPCNEHSDCLLGEKCLAKKCVGELVCNVTSDCAKGQVCADEKCVTGECVDNFDCPGLVCRSFKCVAP